MSGPFSRRGAALLAGGAIASLAAAALLGIFGDAFDPATAQADAWSRSAVGHHAFVELLRRVGHPVVVSRHATEEKAGDGAAVALLEPALGESDPTREETLRAIDRRASRLLVVLPKRIAFADRARPRWASHVALESTDAADQVLAALAIDGEVVRPTKAPAAWRGPLPAPTLQDVQLVRSSELRPLLETDEGILVGELEGGGFRTVVVADPDLLETHGLGRGDNAVLAIRIAERLGPRDLPVVVDETLHGNALQPSIARELLRPPLLLATLQALLAFALVGWAASVRFGRPRPQEGGLAPGKAFLVDNTADLLRYGGHVRHAAVAYLRAAKDEVLARLRPPGETSDPEAWLVRAAAARGQARTLRLLEERVSRLEDGRRGAEEEAVRAARAIHHWREEMIDGAAGDPRHDRAAQG